MARRLLRSRLFLAPAVVILAALAAPLAAQQWLPPRPDAPRVSRPTAAAAVPAALRRQMQRPGTPRDVVLPVPAARVGPARATTAEVEPNDSLSKATPVALGDTVTGVINPAGDVDYFAVDLQAGTVVDIRVEAQSLGSPLDSYIALFAADTTLLGINDDYAGLDSRIVAAIPRTGRYYVGITDYRYPTGGPTYTYRILIRTITTDETEPNNTAATANPVRLNDTVIAAIGASDDVDFFALDVTSATYLGVATAPVGSWINLVVAIVGTDGTTLLACDSSGSGTQRYLAAAGRYYVSVRPLYGGSGLYQLTTRVLPTGPGDPVTVVYPGLGFTVLTHAAAGLSGDVYASANGNSLVHISATGTATTIGQNISTFTVDGFGDVLGPGWDDATGRQILARVNSAGTQTVFAADAPYFYALTTGPDGDVWGYGCRSICGLWRYDPVGRLKDSTALSMYPSQLAFSPGGVLHFVNGSDTVYQVSQGRLQAAIVATGGYFTALAFDTDGFLYLADAATRTIQLYDASYRVAAAPFAATNLSYPTSLFFLRDASGAMTSRLLAANGSWGVPADFANQLVEVNPSGVRAAGQPLQPRLLRIAQRSLRPGTVGHAYADTVSLAEAVAGGRAAWRVDYGSLPPGLTLDGATGVLSGVPSDSGWYAFTLVATAGGRSGPGAFTLEVGVPALGPTDVVNALLGVAGVLGAEDERFLDLQGNRNGHMDIGDVRAFLRKHGQLAASAPARAPAREDKP